MTKLTPSTVAVVNQPLPIRTRDKMSTTSSAPAVQPPTPTSPRVHFSSNASIITCVSRPLSTEEAWDLYHFEVHCRECRVCQSPYKKWRAGVGLCVKGEHLSRIISNIIFQHDGEIYERYTRHHKPMRVEIPHTYSYLREQLRVQEEVAILRRSPRHEERSLQAERPRQERPRVRIHAEEHRHKEAPRRSSSTAAVVEVGHSDKHRRKEKYRQEEPRESKYHEHKHRDKEHRHKYRHEEKPHREHKKTAETGAEINVNGKKYRTQDRRPTWVDEDARARR